VAAWGGMFSDRRGKKNERGRRGSCQTVSVVPKSIFVLKNPGQGEAAGKTRGGQGERPQQLGKGDRAKCGRTELKKASTGAGGKRENLYRRNNHTTPSEETRSDV